MDELKWLFDLLLRSGVPMEHSEIVLREFIKNVSVEDYRRIKEGK